MAATKPPVNPAMEMVKVKVYRPAGTKAKGVYVNVNTHNYFVPYGKEETVPRYIAEVLERSVEQDEATRMMIEQLESDHEAKLKALGI